MRYDVPQGSISSSLPYLPEDKKSPKEWFCVVVFLSFLFFLIFSFFFETNRIKCLAFYDGIMRQKFFLAICVFPFLYTSSQCTISLLKKAAFLVIDRVEKKFNWKLEVFHFLSLIQNHILHDQTRYIDNWYPIQHYLVFIVVPQLYCSILSNKRMLYTRVRREYGF